jgi:hypothetical protein
MTTEKNRSMLVRFYEQVDPAKLTERVEVVSATRDNANSVDNQSSEASRSEGRHGPTGPANQLAVDAILAHYGSDVQALRRALGRKYGHAPRFIAPARGIYVHEKNCTSFSGSDGPGESPERQQSVRAVFGRQ